MIPKIKEVIYLVVGQTISDIRDGKGMSRMQLAKATGLTVQDISYIEAGRTRIGLEQLASIAIALETDMGSLLPKPTPDLIGDGEQYVKAMVEANLKKMANKK